MKGRELIIERDECCKDIKSEKWRKKQEDHREMSHLWPKLWSRELSDKETETDPLCRGVARNSRSPEKISEGAPSPQPMLQNDYTCITQSPFNRNIIKTVDTCNTF